MIIIQKQGVTLEQSQRWGYPSIALGVQGNVKKTTLIFTRYTPDMEAIMGSEVHLDLVGPNHNDFWKRFNDEQFPYSYAQDMERSLAVIQKRQPRLEGIISANSNLDIYNQ